MVLENILVDRSQDDQRESEFLRVLPRVLDTQSRRVGRRSIIQTVDERRIRQLQAQKRYRERKKSERVTTLFIVLKTVREI